MLLIHLLCFRYIRHVEWWTHSLQSEQLSNYIRQVGWIFPNLLSQGVNQQFTCCALPWLWPCFSTKVATTQKICPRATNLDMAHARTAHENKLRSRVLQWNLQLECDILNKIRDIRPIFRNASLVSRRAEKKRKWNLLLSRPHVVRLPWNRFFWNFEIMTLDKHISTPFPPIFSEISTSKIQI